MSATTQPKIDPFAPWTLRGLKLRNRFIKAATYEGHCPGDRPDREGLAAFHEAFARGGAGLCTVSYGSGSRNSGWRAHRSTVLRAVKPTLLAWNNFFGDIGFLGAEQRAYGAVLWHLPWPVLRHLPWPVLRHAKRNFFVRQHWLFDTPAPQPVAGRRRLPKRCFGSGCARPVATLKGAGEPHRTPALMAGFNAVPCASAARRPPGSLLAWGRFCSLRVSAPFRGGDC